ncbi:MAG: hypothetical protein IJR87_13005 [Bacteroidaceae bacterium]|nr:hypothetical protein [Bacteroidaceae bacterium]
MKKRYFAAVLLLMLALSQTFCEARVKSYPVHGGWVKYEGNPVLGGPELGTCFDANVIREGEGAYNMYFSWRPRKSLAVSRSEDGIQWSEPQIVLRPDSTSGWEDLVNRSCTMFWKGRYHMWYTGQVFPSDQPHGISRIGYAVSDDGVHFTRVQREPVLKPEMQYEGYSVMNPYVIYDEERGVLRMWYSSGETYEPNVECYAESADGIHWERSPLNPIFGKGAPGDWDCDRVGGLEVHRLPDGRFIMFYIGYSDIHTARIGAAVSADGITRWHRLGANPLVEPTPGSWDANACYKPTVCHDRKGRWMLWYNGRRGSNEFVGLVTHQGDDLLADEPLAALPDTSLVTAYVADFNSHDHETYRQYIPNDQAADFLKANIPLFDCPDKELERTYYFRWWTYRKHLKQTPDGFVITEFLPQVGWSGKHNSINCPASHHFYEGRWLRNSRFLDDYARFWFYGGGSVRRYTFPAAEAIWNYMLVHPNQELEDTLYERLKENYAGWERERRDSTGLFWQVDGLDGMEVSISGYQAGDHSGYRPTINSYMYGECTALALMARQRGRQDDATLYEAKARELKQLVDRYLWDPEAQFYEVVPRFNKEMKTAGVREELGYLPFMYGLADRDKLVAWEQLFDPQGFKAPYGPTTAEQRHPQFEVAYKGHECQWNGPSWPYATCQTLKGMARSLNRFGEEVLSREGFMEVLQTYSRSHRMGQQCFIDENLNPYTGDWIARTLLRQRGDVIPDRGKDYNHSTFVDNIISDLIGLHADERGRISLRPLLPRDYWDWFALMDVSLAGHRVDVIYDRTGRHYGRGKGLQLIIDGKARRVHHKHKL